MTKRTTTQTAAYRAAQTEIAETFSPKLAAVLAIVFGSFILFGAGFAEAVHDTAHDSRHAFVFPCH